MSKINVPQPLYRPAPFVAYGSSPGFCYFNPVFLSEYVGTEFDGIDLLGYASQEQCGTAALYAQCSTGNSLVVLYPPATAPHSYVAYGAAGCFSYAGTVTSAGTYRVTVAGSVTPVVSCTDVICTGSNFTGNSYAYFDHQQGQQVNVQFEGLNLGIPKFGVAASKTDVIPPAATGGSVAVYFKNRTTEQVATFNYAARVIFRIGSTRFAKTLLVVRAGSTLRYDMSPLDSSLALDIQAGDVVRLEIVGSTGRLPSSAVGFARTLTWEPIVAMPRLYDAGTVSFSTASIKALGFCGVGPHQKYTLYGTVPVDIVATEWPANPGGYVTVQGSGAEMAIVRTRLSGQQAPDLGTKPWYDGSPLVGGAVFRFYAVNAGIDSHGEMDVWFNGTAGQFPTALKVDDYRVLVTAGSSYRCTTEVDDVHRNSVRVVAGPAGIELPGVYAASDGQLQAFSDSAGTVVYDSKTFVRVGSDPGLSSSIL